MMTGRRGKGWTARRLAYAMAVTLSVAAGPLAMGLCPAGPARADDSPLVRTGATEPSTVLPMGGVTLRVPDRYLFGSIYRERSDDAGLSFRIQVLLPDMEPQTPANTQEFQKLGWGRKLYAAIYYKGPSLTGQKLFDAMMTLAQQVPEGRQPLPGLDHSGPFSLTRQYFPTSDRIVFTGTRDKPGYFAQCSPDGPSPFCERIILIAPDIYVSYSFARSYLDDYTGIERRLLALLNSFRIHGQPFTVIQ